MEENKVLNEQEIEDKERELWTTRRGVSIAMQHEDIKFLLEEVQRQNMQLHNFFNYGDIIHQLIEYYKCADTLVQAVIGSKWPEDYEDEVIEFTEKVRKMKEEKKDAE